ncbi:MAG: hypothetical protein KGI19_10315 [Thaumarchaeota archaeon]|nr:hypothetical protein [Nitrososphaerota archaeon]
MSSAGAGILGGILGAGLTYALAKAKIERLEAENEAQARQINALEFDVSTKNIIITQKEEELKRKDQIIKQAEEQIVVRDNIINKLEQKQKRALDN